MAEVPVVCVRANNPGPFTGPGTNSYVVGVGRAEAAIVDPGPDEADHLARLTEAADGARIAAILVTHPHLDHSGGAPRLSASTGAPTIGFGAFGDGVADDLAPLLANLAGGEGADRAFRPDMSAAHGERIASEAGGWTLAALHTPGHVSTHLCFALEDGSGRLFSGDHAMGWSTSLVSPPEGDMTAYLASLDLLIARADRVLLPGHGEIVEDAAARLAELKWHRLARERAILAALSAAGASDAAGLVASVYGDLADALRPAAARNVLAHLLDLRRRGRVRLREPVEALVFTVSEYIQAPSTDP